MPPRRPTLLTAAAALCLAISAAILVLWLRSYWVADWGGYSHVDPPGRRAVDWGVHVVSASGRVSVTAHRDVYDDPATIAQQRREAYGSSWFRHSDDHPSRFVARNVPTVLGVGLGARHNTYPYGRNDNWTVTAPHPAWATPAALVAATGAWRWWNTRALRRPGHCPACGYDLRATPDRCPECGAEPDGVKA